MEINIKRKDINLGKKFTLSILKEKELRVAAYVRVSTDNEEQEISFYSQKDYFENKIKSNEKWTFVKIYYDNGISGTSTSKRNGFVQMINDALDGKIDLILTKSVSRFARNTVDTLEHVKLLKDNNIAVYFEEDNINTLDMNGQLLLTVLSSIAQQESQNLSSHVILGLQMKAKRGEIIGSTNWYGYDYNKEDKTFTINEEEAFVVRKIINLYIEGIGTKKIANILTEEGILTPKGNKVWNEGSITHIIRSEKYVGDVLLGKSFSSDPISKKTIRNNGERDKYYFRNHHPAIIDRETFDKVQSIIEEKRTAFFRRNPDYIGGKYNETFTSKFICGFCSHSVIKCTQSTLRNTKYYCIQNMKVNNKACPESKMIDIEIIKKAFMQMIIKLRKKIKLENKFNSEIKNKINYSRKILINETELDSSKFKDYLFKDLINHVIIGGYDEYEKSTPFKLRFILNSNSYFASKNIKQELNNLFKLFEFDSNQIFYYIDKDKNGKSKQIFVNKIQVTCEINLGE